MPNRNPIDELGDIRAAIRVLKDQEQRLRDEILKSGRNDFSGSKFRVQIEEKTSRRFDKSKLPPQIADNPAYWKETTTLYVRTFPLAEASGKGASSHPQRARGRSSHDDFDVFED